MANPRGNPRTLTPFKPKGEESLITNITIRVYPSKGKALKAIPGWTEKLRDAIDKLIEEYGQVDEKIK